MTTRIGKWRYLSPSVSATGLAKWFRTDGAEIRRRDNRWIAVLPNGVSLKISTDDPVPRQYVTAKRAMQAMDLAKPISQAPAASEVVD